MKTTLNYKLKNFVRINTFYIVVLKIKISRLFNKNNNKIEFSPDSPKISVVIPTFNAQKYLKAALDSLLWQTYTNFEILIIDDKSTDKTRKIISKYKDKRIKLIEGEEKGIAAALNLGLKESKGEYIARMDADDICMPKRFEEQLKILDSHPDVGACFIEPKMFGKLCYYWSQDCKTHEEYCTSLLFKTTVCHPTVIFRKAEFEQNEIKYDEDFKYYEDFEIWSRAIHKVKFYTICKNLFLYRMHGSNSCTRAMDKSKNYAFKIIKKNFYQHLNYELDDLTLKSLWWKEPTEFTKEEYLKILEKYQEILDVISKNPKFDVGIASKHLSEITKQNIQKI